MSKHEYWYHDTLKRITDQINKESEMEFIKDSSAICKHYGIDPNEKIKDTITLLPIGRGKHIRLYE